MITNKKETKEFIRCLIDEKLTYSKLEKRLGYKQGYAKVKVSRLKKARYIKKGREGYHLTEKGNKLYRTPEPVITTQGKQVNIHFHKIKAKVLHKNLYPKEDFLKTAETIIQVRRLQEQITISELNNTKVIIFKNLLGTEIRATTKHILIKIPKLIYQSLDHCLLHSEKYFNEILPKLERFFDIKIDNKFINQFWVSTRHIEYVNNYLALIHKKYKQMHIEILDNKTGKRLLYFDESGNTINAETEHIKQGVDVGYNLEQFDRDLVDGFSMSNNFKTITDFKVSTNAEVKDIKNLLSMVAVNQSNNLKIQDAIIKDHQIYGEHAKTHTNLLIKLEKKFEEIIGLTEEKAKEKYDKLISLIKSKEDVLKYPDLVMSLSTNQKIDLSHWLIENFD